MGLRWDLFCRVVDNFGDVGVCWRLAVDLAARGHRVRLVIDDARALAWMAPPGFDAVRIAAWADVERDASFDDEAIGRDGSESGMSDPAVKLGHAVMADVVIEAFGCTLPPSVSSRIFAADVPPVWVNLEYLTAEHYAEDAHGLASPQFDADRRRVDKWFFFPGFGEASGGLIREAGLAPRREAFSPAAWLMSRDVARRAGERIVSLFCYENDRLAGLLDTLAAPDAAPTLVLATAGHATRQVVDRLGPTLQCGSLRAIALPWLAQLEYDHLLWSSDVNFVRGEDSFVRAHWAGVPFVWQAYPQDGGAHHAKVEAFLAAMSPPSDVRALVEGWNGIGPAPAREIGWPDHARWQDHVKTWRQRLAEQPDLVSRLVAFVAGKR